MRTTLRVMFGVLFITGASAADHQAPHWSYEGEQGPTHWAQMDSGFSTCALGQVQSPIDIRNAVEADLPEIDFDYHAGPAEVINNGHTVQVSLPASGGIEIADERYALLQFHFHTPSEEKIAGMAYPMVAHFVHQNTEGRLAVVAVLVKEGKQNPAFVSLFANLPAQGQKQALPSSFDPARLMPEKRGYYAFEGSLTTPPCSESVRWQVLKEPIEVSSEQLAAFRHLYPMNARPTQPLNGRLLQQSRN
ncbi:MAG: carbonic anhydrase [Pseudomonadota bacterium]